MSDDAPVGEGVIGERAALDQARDQAAVAAPPVTPAAGDGTLRLEVLRIAAYHNDEPDAVTARADTYLDWIQNHG